MKRRTVRRRRSNLVHARIATTLLAAGCGPSAAPTRAGSEAVAPSTPSTAAFERDAVYHDRFARRTLYSWTTPDQIAELRTTQRLLVREESPQLGAAYIDQVLHALADRGDPIGRLLYTTTFAKMRFAWHAPWATRLGWTGEQYGDQLIRITLRPEAILLGLSSATGTFDARDLKGMTVSRDDVIAHPERIAAIYFVSEAGKPPATGIPRPLSTYREYVVCNEAMVESWSIGTDEIAAELEIEAIALDSLVRYLRTRPNPGQPIALSEVWVHAPPRQPRPEDSYAAVLAFDNAGYRLDADQLAALARQLRATPRLPTLVTEVTQAFPGIGPARNAPRVVPPKNRGTYGTFGTYVRPSKP